MLKYLDRLSDRGAWGFGLGHLIFREEAREQRDELRKLIKRGIDPLDRRPLKSWRESRGRQGKSLSRRLRPLHRQQANGWKKCKTCMSGRRRLEKIRLSVIGDIRCNRSRPDW